jgi:hypothetical protein
MIPLWKGKNYTYFGVITIIPFDNSYRRAYFVMHTFLVVSIEPVVYENKKLGKSARTISSGDKLSFEWTFFSKNKKLGKSARNLSSGDKIHKTFYDKDLRHFVYDRVINCL